jgi:hypothetical protein
LDTLTLVCDYADDAELNIFFQTHSYKHPARSTGAISSEQMPQ